MNHLVAGANYDWPVREGTFALDPVIDPDSVFPLPPGDIGFTYPVAQYDHDEGSAIAGGFVYRGAPPHPLTGQFVFGNIVNVRVFHAAATELLAADDGNLATTASVKELNLLRDGQPTSLLEIVADMLGPDSVNRVGLRFGTDFEGNLYVTTKQDGFVRQLEPVPEPSIGLLRLFVVVELAGLAMLKKRARLLLENWASAALGRGSSRRRVLVSAVPISKHDVPLSTGETVTKKWLILGLSFVAVAGLGYAAGSADLGIMTIPDELQWQALRPGSPLKMAALWGSPSEGEIAVLIKVPAGYVGAIHDHTGDYHGVNVAGTWRHSFEGGEERSQPPGSYVFQPAAKQHKDACIGPEDCIWFVHQHGKLDFVPKQ